MDAQSPQTEDRLFSIFETADENVLREQCMHDLAALGFDSFQCRQKTARILENAQKASVEYPRRIESLSSEGVTKADYEWYWWLPPVARVAMRCFDDELCADMWFRCHARNICFEGLVQDLARSLPTFSNDVTDGDGDAPLPHELRRRFHAFIAKARADEDEWLNWDYEAAKATSMNSLIRNTIREGNM